MPSLAWAFAAFIALNGCGGNELVGADASGGGVADPGGRDGSGPGPESGDGPGSGDSGSDVRPDAPILRDVAPDRSPPPDVRPPPPATCGMACACPNEGGSTCADVSQCVQACAAADGACPCRCFCQGSAWARYNYCEAENCIRGLCCLTGQCGATCSTSTAPSCCTCVYNTQCSGAAPLCKSKVRDCLGQEPDCSAPTCG